jgi:hypothetical protein
VTREVAGAVSGSIACGFECRSHPQVLRACGPAERSDARTVGRAHGRPADFVRVTRSRTIAAFVAWAIALAVGLGVMFRYETTAGATATVPTTWPAGSQLPRRSGRATVVLFAHPMCPCTRASLRELAAIMADDHADGDAIVAFVHPDSVGDRWDDSPSWQIAARIPHTTRFIDRDGVEADRFGAMTSGQVAVYDAGGALVFAGGITASRGHVGDNIGSRAVLARLATVLDDQFEHPVYGCPLGGGSQ